MTDVVDENGNAEGQPMARAVLDAPRAELSKVAVGIVKAEDVQDGGRVLVGGREAAGILGALTAFVSFPVALLVRRRGTPPREA